MPGNPTLNTSPMGAPSNVLKGTATGVIASVDNAKTPKYVSILVDNTFPVQSGFTIPSGAGPFAAGGTSGFSYFYNNSSGVGGSIVTVDLDTRTVVSFTGSVSTSAPSPRYSNMTNHLHIGNLNPATGSVPGTVNSSGTGTVIALYPYKKSTGVSLTPVLDSGNVISTEFSSLTGTSVISPTNIVVPIGAALVANWVVSASVAGETYGPGFTDGTNTYQMVCGQTTSSFNLNGSVLSAVSASPSPFVNHTFTLVAIYLGGTTWQFVGYIDQQQVLFYTHNSSPFSPIIASAFYTSAASTLTFTSFDYYGTSEALSILENPAYSTAPVISGTPTITYPANDGTNVWANVNFTLSSTAPLWASGLRLFYTTAGGAAPNPATAPYIDIPAVASGVYSATWYIQGHTTSQDLYVGYTDFTDQVGSLVKVYSSTTSNPTQSSTTGLPTTAPVSSKAPSGFSYVENLAQSTFDVLAWIYLTMPSTLSQVATVEYVYASVGTTTWSICGEGTPVSGGTYQALWDNLPTGTQYNLGVRFRGNGVVSAVLTIGTTISNPDLVPVAVSAALTTTAPAIQTGSTSVVAVGSGNLPGVLDDIEVTTTITNIPQDGSVNRLLWLMRKAQDPVIATSGSSVIKVQTSYGANGLNFQTAPQNGNLVVIIVANDAYYTYSGGTYTFNGVWTPVTGNIILGTSVAVAYKIWNTSTDSNSLAISNVPGSCAVIAYEFSGFNTTNPVRIPTVNATTASSSPQIVTGQSVIPGETSEYLIAATGWSPAAGSGSTGYSYASSYTATTTNPTEWTVDGLSLDPNYYGYASIITTASYSSLSRDTANAVVFPGFQLSTAAPSSNFYTTMIEIRSATPSAVTGGTQYPWINYDEQDVYGYPYPAVSQQVENGFGQVSMGVTYDFAVAFVNEDTVIGPQTTVVSRYTSPNKLQIPGNYLIGNVAYTPTLSPGIPTTSGVPSFPVAVPSANVITQTLQPNGLNAAYLLSFQVTNQPVDGSLSRIVYYYRITSATYGSGATAAQNPWSYYSSAPASGAGLALAKLPGIGNYQELILDISVANNVTYDFGIACRDNQNNETIIVLLGTSVSIAQAPPGLNNGSTNLVVDSGFKASKYATGTGGFSTTPVSTSNPYWYVFGLSSTAVIAQSPPNSSQQADLGNYIGADLANGSTRFGAISWPINVTAGVTYTLSAVLNARLDSGGPCFVAIVDSSGSNTYSTKYLQLNQTNGVSGTVSGTWTCPVTGGPTTVAVVLDSNGDSPTTGGYLYMAKPMLQIGSSPSAYVDGPATPPTGQATSTVIAVQPQGTTPSASSNATNPTISNSTAVPVSGGSAPTTDQQPQGSLRFTPLGTFRQSGTSTTSPTWRPSSGLVYTTASYSPPAVNSSGTVTVETTATFVANQYIQIAGGTTPFVGLITAIASSTTLTVTTVVVGSASTISSGAAVTYGGGSSGSGGTVTAVTASGVLSSSGGTTPNITFTGTLPVANGGTGSTTQNFVDLTTTQTIAGAKTFSGALTANAGITSTTGTFSAGITATTGTFSGGSVALSNGTSNLISWNSAGVGFPTFTTSSVGTKLLLYPFVSGSAADFAIGIAGSTLWFGVPTTGQQFQWYGGTTLAATLSGVGALTLVAGLTATTGTFSGAVSAASLSLTTALPISSGGTGSATQNFVDLTTAQTIAGAKTFSGALTANGGITSTTGTFSSSVAAGGAYVQNAGDIGCARTTNVGAVWFGTSSSTAGYIYYSGGFSFGPGNYAVLTNYGQLTLTAGLIATTAAFSSTSTFTGLITANGGLTAAATVTVAAQGTATSGGNFASNALSLTNSYWTGSAAASYTATIELGSGTAVGTNLSFYNSSMTGTSGKGFGFAGGTPASPTPYYNFYDTIFSVVPPMTINGVINANGGLSSTTGTFTGAVSTAALTAAGTFTVSAQGTATSGGNFASNAISLTNSYWTGSAAAAFTGTIELGSGTSVGTNMVFYNSSMTGSSGKGFGFSGGTPASATPYYNFYDTLASIVPPMTVTGLVTVNGGLVSKTGITPGNTTAAGTAQIYSGTGVPTFSAPNGSVYFRYDGTPGTSCLYMNTSGASTSGTTWTAKF